jgi:prepilin-type processing-associated H-X9-DG protein
MAVASLVCGLAFCIPACPVLAIIFGIIGIRRTGEGRMHGRGLAIAGLVLGVVLGTAGISVELAMLPGFRRGLVVPTGRREVADRVKCAANERSIGQAILLYCNDNQGQYPPDLVALVKNEDITTGIFVCPSSNDTPATSPDSLLSGGHCSYIYLGQRLTTSADPTTVVLYEDPGDHGDGVNMLFADGHVEFVAATDPTYNKTVNTPSPGR